MFLNCDNDFDSDVQQKKHRDQNGNSVLPPPPFTDLLSIVHIVHPCLVLLFINHLIVEDFTLSPSSCQSVYFYRFTIALSITWLSCRFKRLFPLFFFRQFVCFAILYFRKFFLTRGSTPPIRMTQLQVRGWN